MPASRLAPRLLGVFAALAFTGSLSAQSRPRAGATTDLRPVDQLVGSVVDVIGKPMPDVEVYLARTDRSVRTDARGIFRIQNPPIGPHVVVARSLGYVPYVREVIIGSAMNDTVALLLRRYPRTLSTVEVTASSNKTTASAAVVADRLVQMKVGAGRLYTRDWILEQRPQSIAELVQGVPGIILKRGQGEVVATSTRAGVGIMSTEGQPCQLQFYVNDTPIDNEGVATLDPLNFRSVEVYPMTVLLPGLPMRPDKCGAIVINMMRR